LNFAVACFEFERFVTAWLMKWSAHARRWPHAKGMSHELAMDSGVGFSCRDHLSPYWGAAGPHVGVALIHLIGLPQLAASFI
jgi:hypothetical protein